MISINYEEVSSMKLVAVLSTTVLPLDGVYQVETLPKGDCPTLRISLTL